MERREEARRLLLRLLTLKFGPPEPSTIAALQAIDDIEQMRALAERIVISSSWSEFVDALNQFPRPPNTGPDGSGR